MTLILNTNMLICGLLVAWGEDLKVGWWPVEDKSFGWDVGNEGWENGRELLGVRGRRSSGIFFKTS